MKKILSLVLAVVMAVGALFAAPIQLPGLVLSVNATDTATADLKFALNSDGKSYSVTGYTGGAVNKLIIPAEYEGKPITKIGDNAFYSNQSIKEIVLPNTITEIGSESFSHSSVETINLPDSITTIQLYAFWGCSKLQAIAIPKKVKTLEYLTFCDCDSLTSVTLPYGLKKIGEQVFRGCDNLETIIIPDSVTQIGSMVFDGCDKLKTVTLSQNITGINYQLFIDCKSLTEIIIPNKVTYISSGAFSGCINLEKITIPDSVKTISDTAFNDTKILTDKSNWENGALYIGNHLIVVDNTVTEMYKVKPGTVSLAEYAFTNAKDLVAVYLPKSIKSIDNLALTDSLAFLFYEGTVEEFNKIDFNNNEVYLENTIVILDADGIGVPETPKVKSVTNVAGGVQISWNAVDNADIYLVWRRGSGNSEWTLLGMTDQTTVVDTSPGHRQYWRYSIQAMNFDEVSEFDYTGKYLKYIATPKLTGISNATNGIYFKWNKVAGASGYRVYRREAGKSWVYLGTVKGTSYTDKTVKNASGKYYRYTVRAVVDGVYSGFEDFLFTKRLANPTLKSATNGNGGITVKWSAVKGTTGYYVYRKTANSNWVRIGAVGGTNNTTFVDKNAKSGTTYTYTVRAVYGSTTSYFNSGIKCKRK